MKYLVLLTALIAVGFRVGEAPALEPVVRLVSDVNTAPNPGYNGFAGISGISSVAGTAGREMTTHQGRLFMVAETPETGWAIFSTDGSESVARLELDPNPGPYSDQIGGIFGSAGPLYFQRGVGHEWTLWAMDSHGAREVASLTWPLRTVVSAGDRAVFSTDAGLWGVDGSGDLELIDTWMPDVRMWYPKSVVSLGEHVTYVRIHTRSPAQVVAELVATDGTSAGTRVLKEIPIGSDWDWRYAAHAVADQDRAWVTISNSLDKVLLTTDGTEEGSRVVKHWQAQHQVVDYDGLAQPTAHEGRLFFVEGLMVNGMPTLRVWRSDGTEASTLPVDEVSYTPNGTWSGRPFDELVAVSGGVLFRSTHLPYPQSGWIWRRSDSGAEPVVINGDNIATGLIRHADGNPTRINGHALVSIGNSRFYGISAESANTVVVDTEVDLQFQRAYAWNGRLVIPAGHDSSAIDLWQTDGTSEGTAPLVDVWDGTDSLGVGLDIGRRAVHLGGRVFAIGRRSDHAAVPPNPLGIVSWNLDGGPSVFHEMSGLVDIERLVNVQDNLVYVARTPSGTQIRHMRSDFSQGGSLVGSAPGSDLVAVNGPGASFVVFRCNPQGIFDDRLCSWLPSLGPQVTVLPPVDVSWFDHVGSAGDVAYFNLGVFGSGSAVWRSDGTPAGTFAIAPGQVPRATFDRGAVSAAIDDRLVFCADTGSLDWGLWASDGQTSGTSRLLALDGPCGGFTSDGKVAYFMVWRSTHLGTEGTLWRTDGTLAGTQVLFTGEVGGLPEVVGSHVHVGGFAQGYLISDGTSAGTRLVELSEDWGPWSEIRSTSSVSASGARESFAVWHCDLATGDDLCMISEDGDALFSADIYPGQRPLNTIPPPLFLGGGAAPLIVMADDGRHGVEAHVIKAGGLFANGFEMP